MRQVDWYKVSWPRLDDSAFSKIAGLTAGGFIGPPKFHGQIYCWMLCKRGSTPGARLETPVIPDAPDNPTRMQCLQGFEVDGLASQWFITLVNDSIGATSNVPAWSAVGASVGERVHIPS